MLESYIADLKESINEIDRYFAQKADGRHSLTEEEKIKSNNQVHQIMLLEIFEKMENNLPLSPDQITSLKQAYLCEDALLSYIDAYAQYLLNKGPNLFGKKSLLVSGKENLTFLCRTGEFEMPTASRQSPSIFQSFITLFQNRNNASKQESIYVSKTNFI